MTLSTLQKRLIYLSRKRGILETTLILSNYAQLRVPQFNPHQCQIYFQLLQEMDWDLFDMFRERKPIPPLYKDIVVDIQQTIMKNPEKKLLILPNASYTFSYEFMKILNKKKKRV